MSRFIANINSLEKLTFTSKVSDFQGNRQASPRVSHWMMLRTFEKQGSATSFLRSAQKKRRSFSKKRWTFSKKRGRFSEKCRRKFLKRRNFLKSSRTLAEKHPQISPLLLVKDYKNSASPSEEDCDALKNGARRLKDVACIIGALSPEGREAPAMGKERPREKGIILPKNDGGATDCASDARGLYRDF